MAGRRFSARRKTKNITGGASSIQTENFCMGIVELDPEGGQVPWHNHPDEDYLRQELPYSGERLIEDYDEGMLSFL